MAVEGGGGKVEREESADDEWQQLALNEWDVRQ